MLRLLTLGGLALERDGGEPLTQVLAHPKRLAVLLYLALHEPRGLHQRNALLALFWPESDESHARNALRNTVHFLRSVLGAETILGGAGDAIGIDPSSLSCDAVAFEQALAAGDHVEAMRLYRGPLAPG